MTPSKKATLKVEYVPIKSVKPAKNNTRVHPSGQVDQIRRSIEPDTYQALLDGRQASMVFTDPPYGIS